MPTNTIFFSGSAARLPPREFLKALPARLSHLVFDTEKDNSQVILRKLEKMLFEEDKKPVDNRPSYFTMDESAYCFCPINTTDYLTSRYAELFPSGSGWIVRWEKHSSFVTVTFFRYFAASSKSLKDKADNALACLHRASIPPENLVSEIVPGGYIDVAVIPYTWNLNDASEALALDESNPFVTKSLVFNRVAKLWMSFEVEENDKPRDKHKPRPVLIYGRQDMNESVAGELIQVLLEIETYRLIASCRTSEEELRTSISRLGEHEDKFTTVASIIEDYLKKRPCLFKDMIKDMILVEDFLPVLRTLGSISIALEKEIAEHAIRDAAAQAYRDLVISRLTDLHEKEIDHYPSINRFLRHRLEQITHTSRAIGKAQDKLSERISRIDGLLRTRMEAREQYALHCVHFLILFLTSFAVLYYLSELFHEIFVWDYATATIRTLVGILIVGLTLFITKYTFRNKAHKELEEK